MTISALPIGPGATKSMGDEGGMDVKRWLRSHVVCHWGSLYVSKTPGKKEWDIQYPLFAVRQLKERRTRIIWIEGYAFGRYYPVAFQCSLIPVDSHTKAGNETHATHAKEVREREREKVATRTYHAAPSCALICTPERKNCAPLPTTGVQVHDSHHEVSIWIPSLLLRVGSNSCLVRCVM